MPEYILPKRLHGLVQDAKARYASPENQLYHVLCSRGTTTNTRSYLQKEEKIKELVEILYAGHPFRQEHEFISKERLVDLLLRTYNVKVYNKKEELIGELLSHQYKFYFAHHESNQYSMHTFEEIMDINLELKFEKDKTYGTMGAYRYIEQLKDQFDLVKVKLVDLA